MKAEDNSRAVFATRFGAIATTVGSAVGLGNIWRFPFEAGVHGGGAFMICYIAFILLIGVPLLCAEFAIGRGTRSNIFGAYHKLKPTQNWRFAGYIGIVASLLILSFYSVVAGWTVEYTISSALGNLSFTDTATGHAQFVRLTTGWRPLVWTLFFLACNFGVLIGGVTKGIERASNILMPVLFLLLAAFCVNSFTLSGFDEGIRFLFNPDFSKITPSVLLGALGQAFFSLSLGLGGMMTYASYFSGSSRLGRTAVTTAMLDTLVAILAGVIIFPAVFTFGISPSAARHLSSRCCPIYSVRLCGRRNMVHAILSAPVPCVAHLNCVNERDFHHFLLRGKEVEPTQGHCGIVADCTGRRNTVRTQFRRALGFYGIRHDTVLAVRLCVVQPLSAGRRHGMLYICRLDSQEKIPRR